MSKAHEAYAGVEKAVSHRHVRKLYTHKRTVSFRFQAVSSTKRYMGLDG